MKLRSPNLEWTAKKRARWLADGRGGGEGANYRPWLTVLDVPGGKSTKSRLKESRHGRVCHLLSSIEERAFLILDYSGWRRFELYDQYRLDLDETRAIAKELKIPHPRAPGTSEDWDITTDLLRVNEQGQFQPFSCKPRNKVVDWNQIEHAEIERVYWKRRNAPLKIILDDESCLPDQLIRNLRLLAMHRFLNEQALLELSFENLIAKFRDALDRNAHDCTFLTFCQCFAEEHSLPIDQGFSVGAYCLYRNLVHVDLSQQDLRKLEIRKFRTTGH